MIFYKRGRGEAWHVGYGGIKRRPSSEGQILSTSHINHRQCDKSAQLALSGLHLTVSKRQFNDCYSDGFWVQPLNPHELTFIKKYKRSIEGSQDFFFFLPHTHTVCTCVFTHGSFSYLASLWNILARRFTWLFSGFERGG